MDNPHEGCALPYELGNFQGFYECEPSVGVARPTTLEEMSKIVTAYDQVKAVGVGHSWWQQQFCAGHDERSADIVMTELQVRLHTSSLHFPTRLVLPLLPDNDYRVGMPCSLVHPPSNSRTL